MSATKESESTEVTWFTNHYVCPRCKLAWTDRWTAMCDDDCPHCGARHISPTSSEEDDDGEEAKAPALDRYKAMEAASKVDGYYFPTPYEGIKGETAAPIARAKAEAIKNLEKLIANIRQLTDSEFFKSRGSNPMRLVESAPPVKTAATTDGTERDHPLKSKLHVGRKVVLENGVAELLVMGTIAEMHEDHFKVKHAGGMTQSKFAFASFVENGDEITLLDCEHFYASVY